MKKKIKIINLLILILNYFQIKAKSYYFLPDDTKISFDFGKIIYYGVLVNKINKITSYSHSSELWKRTPICPEFKGNIYEINLTINYRKIILDLDFGYSNTNFIFTSIIDETLQNREDNHLKNEYKSSGFFIKYGICYDFLKETEDRNNGFLGIKHCLSFYDEEAEGFLNSDFEINLEEKNNLKKLKKNKNEYEKISFNRKKLFANWFELIAGVKVKLFWVVYIGSSLRYKFFLNQKNLSEGYYIPGFGEKKNLINKNCFGINFYLSFDIFSKKFENKKIEKDKKPYFSF